MGERLDEVLANRGGNDGIAEELKRLTGYETSGEKIRKARRGDNQTIAHDLVAAVGSVYGADLTWLLTGRKPGEREPRPAGVEKGTDLEAEWLASLRDIRQSEGTQHQKTMSRDSLAGIIGRIAWHAGEKAAEERARAVRSGDEIAVTRANTPTSPAAPVQPVQRNTPEEEVRKAI